MSPFLDVASSLALEAGARLMSLRLTPLIKERKADHSWVTNADKEADQIIRSGLRKAFPDHSILTEESGLEGSPEAEYVWVVDPLDGTKAYVNGAAGFSVMIGLLKGGKPFAGVVFDPSEGYLYTAIRGEGSFYSSGGEMKSAHVSSRKDFDDMPIITSTGFPERLYGLIRKELKGPWVPAVNSVGAKVGFVVRQLADIYINHHSVHYWDTCAPEVILEEAGGVMTFIDGQSLFYDLGTDYRHRGPMLTTNGVRHAELLEIVGGLMRREGISGG